MSDSEYTHIDVDEIKAETQKAFLIRVGKLTYWVPFSQIADYEDYNAGDEDVTMSIKTWLCEEKGLA